MTLAQPKDRLLRPRFCVAGLATSTSADDGAEKGLAGAGKIANLGWLLGNVVQRTALTVDQVT